MMAFSEQESCRFPLFRETFLDSSAWQSVSEDDDVPSTSQPEHLRSLERLQGGKKLASLDLRSLSRGDGPPSELQARREKYAFYEKQCSEVAEGILVASDVVARNRETLRNAGVTHVINCVGFLYPPYFKDELQYLVLYLQDAVSEDIASVIYDVFDFIEGARASGGRVLIHCSQGVSRSVALAIAYLMWKQGQPFDEVLTAVKAVRGVANPNIGFTCQLLNWQKRASSDKGPIMYRIAPQSAAVPKYLVPKAVQAPTMAALDPRGAFVVVLKQQTIIWQGRNCHPKFAEAADKVAAQLANYDGASTPPVIVKEGGSEAQLECLAELSPEDTLVRENAAYDHDYQMFMEAVGGMSSGRGSDSEITTSSVAEGGSRAPDTARTDSSSSGRAPKTPRALAEDVGSPNHRSRKMRRSSGPEHGGLETG